MNWLGSGRRWVGVDCRPERKSGSAHTDKEKRLVFVAHKRERGEAGGKNGGQKAGGVWGAVIFHDSRCSLADPRSLA